MMWKPVLFTALGLTVLAAPSQAQTTATAPVPEVVEKLGQTIPMDLTFTDENGQTVTLGELIDKPTVLTLVYYGCPGICSPLLREVASVVVKTPLEPGQDYELVTVSFDPREGTELAQLANKAIRQSAKRTIPDGAWHFLTGRPENINKLTDAVGFHYVPDGDDFIHPATVIFLTKDGKIVRYLNGLEILPADLQLAVTDATAGRARSFMQRIQRICYSYDPAERTYVFKINRIILFATVLFVAVFGGFLLWRGRKPAPPSEKPS